MFPPDAPFFLEQGIFPTGSRRAGFHLAAMPFPGRLRYWPANGAAAEKADCLLPPPAAFVGEGLAPTARLEDDQRSVARGGRPEFLALRADVFIIIVRTDTRFSLIRRLVGLCCHPEEPQATKDPPIAHSSAEK